MRKNIGSNLIICLLVTILFFIIYYSNYVIDSVIFSISIWKDNLFPTLFPFFIISNLLIQYGFVDKISNIFGRFMISIFHLPKEACFPLFISLFSGFPSGAKTTFDLVKNNVLTEEQASRLITFTHYSNPLFILGFIGTIIFGNQKIGFIILISHILSGLLVGILFRPRKVLYNNSKNINVVNGKISFGKVLKDSIFNSLEIMFLLLGIVTVFLILTTILTELFSYNDLINAVIGGILEMTQGVKNVGLLPISLLSRMILITVFISFGGFSIHIQVLSIISDAKIKYKYFFVARILHSIFASILVFIFYILLKP